MVYLRLAALLLASFVPALDCFAFRVGSGAHCLDRCARRGRRGAINVPLYGRGQDGDGDAKGGGKKGKADDGKGEEGARLWEEPYDQKAREESRRINKELKDVVTEMDNRIGVGKVGFFLTPHNNNNNNTTQRSTAQRSTAQQRETIYFLRMRQFAANSFCACLLLRLFAHLFVHGPAFSARRKHNSREQGNIFRPEDALPRDPGQPH